jgi:hypothetical protein
MVEETGSNFTCMMNMDCRGRGGLAIVADTVVKEE